MERRSLTEIFKQVKQDRKEVEKLMEGSREDLLRTFFSLCKGDGKYKSEKQGKYLQAQSEDGVFHIVQTLNFGTSRHSQRQVEWTVVLDDEGVVEITKNTKSKGRETYWSREHTDTVAGKKDVQKAKNSAIMQKEMREIIAHHEKFRDEKLAEVQKAKNALESTDPQVQELVQRIGVDTLQGLIAKYEGEAAEIQSNIDRITAHLK